MGSEIAIQVAKNPLLELKAGLVKSGSEHEGVDIGEIVKIGKIGALATSNLAEVFAACDAVIDFSSPALSLECARVNARSGKILVCGTTGFDEAQKLEFVECAKTSVILWSSNMSIGANLLIKLAEKVAAVLHNDYDVDIVEMHHRNKIDSPSGTALSLGAAVAKGRGLDFDEIYKKMRLGNEGKREKDEIRFSSVRGGDIVGDHTVIFAGTGECVKLSHEASNRSIFALGAIRAAIWGSNQKPGFYTMLDVLSLV